MPSKYELIQALPDKVSKAVSAVRNLTVDDAPEAVQKDLRNLIACVNLSVTKVSKAVTSLMDKPTVVAYLAGLPPPTKVDLDAKLKDMEAQLADQRKMIARLMEVAKINEDLIKVPSVGPLNKDADAPSAQSK
ncbi:B protein [Covert mortality nodavirus]|nr:B protein [Covert mortality nodavirus]